MSVSPNAVSCSAATALTRAFRSRLEAGQLRVFSMDGSLTAGPARHGRPGPVTRPGTIFVRSFTARPVQRSKPDLHITAAYSGDGQQLTTCNKLSSIVKQKLLFSS